MWFAVILFLQAQFFNGHAGVVGSFSRGNNEIVGGEEIEITDAPHQVGLLFKGDFICGGSIVAKDVVITAAHCLSTTNPLDYTVRVGSSYSGSGGQVLRVAKVLGHPDYNSNNDIAIVWLSKPVTFSDKVAAIPMKDSNEEVPDGAMTQVTGYGATDPWFKNYNVKLRRVMVPKVNHDVCQKAYAPAKITPQMLCAGFPEGGKDACQGDSGGPLIHDGKLAGIVSFGAGCARPDYPGVYAKMSALRKWVDDQLHLRKLGQMLRADFN
ncbi:vitellin-degrading protease-like [Ostrinia nubilalis]|uniref:vitellin-degrading protease-like n=1 Tax=Ostrinia nubilalis TaxID=29057 RepID=UPI0030822A71